jgi:Peptidase inhibitor family I36
MEWTLRKAMNRVAIMMVVGLAALTAISLGPSLGASAQATVSANAVSANPAAVSGQWNIYADIDLSGDCMHTNISEASLGECRNIDESFWNNTDAPVRLYYGPSWASPWICFDAGFRTNDLSGYWFNSGGGASNHTGVYRDVASVGVGTPGSKCSNPGENE